MNKIALGQYYHGNSIIHRIDARIKIIGSIFFMVSVFLIPRNDFLVLIILATIALTAVFLTKVPFLRFIKGLKQVAFLLIFSFVFQVFFNHDGKVLINVNLKFSYLNIFLVALILIIYILISKYLKGKIFIFLGLIILSIYILTLPIFITPFKTYDFTINSGGVIVGLFIVSRVFILIMFSSILTLTTKPTDINNALESLLRPFEKIGLKTSILAMMTSIALRSIPTLFLETDRILKAQASRGVDFNEGKIKEKIAQIISLLVPMFIISFKRSEELADAMEARGYIPGAKRTKLADMRLKWGDIVVLVSLFIILGWMICYAILIAKGVLHAL